MHFPIFALLVSGIVGLAGQVAADDDDAAMVLDIIGTTNPAVEPFSMLKNETMLQLGDNSEVELVHLNSCELIRVKGGTIEVSDFGIDASGKELLRGDDECPEEARLTGETTTGGVTLRTGDVVLVPARPVLVLAAPAVDVMLAMAETKTLLHKWAPAKRILSWPKDLEPLPGKTRFLLTVRYADRPDRHAVLLVDPDGRKHRLPILLGGD